MAWQLLMLLNAGYCGWTAFNLFHAKRFIPALLGALACGAALLAGVTSMQFYMMA